MSLTAVVQSFVFLVFVAICIPLLGSFIAVIFKDKKTFLYPIFGWLERLSYRLAGINPHDEMHWQRYLKSMLLFNLFGFLLLFLILLLQAYLPLNPQNFPGVPPLLAFNIAASFATHTNWQSYTPETTLSYGSQMWGLTVQNYLSAATSCAILMAFIRGITRKTTDLIGNFWSDVIRIIVYLLLPLSILLGIILISQGVVQSLSPYVELEMYEGGRQIIPLGPAASQIAIKQLGSNGGGFFNANSSHPFENPTGLSNFLEMAAVLIVPAAIIYAYGIWINSRKHAWMLLGVMFAIWFVSFALASYAEHLHNPILGAYPNMEGKEARFGITNSTLWTVSTTTTSNGSVNAMISSMSPLAGGVALLNMMLEEIVFGGAGVGLCNMLMFVILTIFLSGLMVGRTPEYLGKKLDRYDMQWVIISLLGPAILILAGSALACVLPDALSSLSSRGPHGLTELLYAFTSSAVNNGSSFAGINANTDFYNLTLGIVMVLGRLSILIPSIVIAGNMALKKNSALSVGTLSTDSFLFSLLLFSVILIVGALTYFPALCLGPIVEHFLMLNGRVF